jgi:uncharacterized delta-60 repeat protein
VIGKATAATVAIIALSAAAAGAAPATLDKTFDRDGWTAIDSGGGEVATAMVVQPDGKTIVAGGTTVGGNAAVYRLNVDGSLDRTFDGDGAVGIDSGGFEEATALALQSDGKIVVAGRTTVGGNAVVYRLLANGQLDPTFDGDGRVGIDSGGTEGATGVAVQPDGKIVVVGWTTVGSNAAVYRLNANGSFDTTFDGDGARGIDSGGDELATAVALQPNGKILVAGGTSIGENATLYRLNPNGSFDTTFDGDGALGIDSGGAEGAYAMALQPDGKIVLTGYSSIGGDAVVYRVNPNGSMDSTFDHDGAIGLDSGGGEVGYAVKVQPNGKIVVAGVTSDGDDAVLWRLKRDGSRDKRFDQDGELTLDVGGFNAAFALALTADGRIEVAGRAGAATEDAMVVRLKGDGSKA